MNKLWRVLKPYRKRLLGAVACIVTAAVLTAISPTLEGMVTTQLASDVNDIREGVAGAHIQYDVIWNIVLSILILQLINFSSRLGMQRLVTSGIQASMFDLRLQIKKKMTRLPIRYFDSHAAGDLMSRMTTDMETLSGALQQSFSQILMAILNLSFAVFFMFKINWQMASVAVLIIPISVVVARVIVIKSQRLFAIQQASLGALNSVVQEKFTGFNIIKLYNYQDNAIEDFAQANNALCENGFKANFISGLMTPIVLLLTYVIMAICVLMGVIKVTEGVLVVGALQAFVRYIWQVNQPLSQVTQLAPTIQSAMASLNRITEYLDEPDDIEDVTYPIKLEEYQGSVVFDHIHFGYDETPIIKDVSVDIKPGELVAIVGPTGAGKTTIINLLMRFYDVDSGAIRIDGVDIRDMRRDNLRSLFGMVLQDTWLFSGKIKDNIRYGKPEASDAEIIEAAQQANVHHFITTLPNGYDMILNEESSNISNGEKQLITIARALLSDPKILILDEATSSVDTRLDALIQEALKTLMKGRTSFVIAHRLSTIRNADKILVMRDGNIIETGNHDDLMEKQGFYADLYNSQFDEEAE